MSKNIGIGTYESNYSKLTLNDFILNLEHAIAKYDNDLKHTINGKKEYVFKEDEFVGESKLKFSSQAKEVIEKKFRSLQTICNIPKYQISKYFNS